MLWWALEAVGALPEVALMAVCVAAAVALAKSPRDDGVNVVAEGDEDDEDDEDEDVAQPVVSNSVTANVMAPVVSYAVTADVAARIARLQREAS